MCEAKEAFVCRWPPGTASLISGAIRTQGNIDNALPHVQTWFKNANSAAKQFGKWWQRGEYVMTGIATVTLGISTVSLTFLAFRGLHETAKVWDIVTRVTTERDEAKRELTEAEENEFAAEDLMAKSRQELSNARETNVRDQFSNADALPELPVVESFRAIDEAINQNYHVFRQKPSRRQTGPKHDILNLSSRLFSIAKDSKAPKNVQLALAPDPYVRVGARREAEEYALARTNLLGNIQRASEAFGAAGVSDSLTVPAVL